MAPPVDVERIRTSAERELYEFLKDRELWQRQGFVAQDRSARRRELRAKSLLLTESMAPEAHAAAREAMATLGVQDEIELFQSPSRHTDTACLALYGNPIGIEFIGGYLACLDRGGLLAVIGHEIGHSIAHSSDPKFGWVFAASQGATTPHLRAYAMAAEITADRFGLLACRDLDAVLRLEMRDAAGSSATSIRFDTEAYLRQCRSLAEDIIARGGMVFGHTHPEHSVRAYAEWLFTETDVYAEMTGTGAGSRSIEEVDGIVHQLLGVGTLELRRAAPATAERTDEEQAPTQATRAEGTERSGSEILTDDVRRKIAAAGNVLANVADAVSPSLARLTNIARQRLARSERAPESPTVDEGPDLLEQEKQELLARFEELEKRSQEK